MTSHRPLRWRLPRNFQIHLQSWDDETVAYHSGSGDTHLLGPVETAALHALQRQAADVGNLARHVAADLDLPADQELIAHLDALMLEFQKLGLVEPDPA